MHAPSFWLPPTHYYWTDWRVWRRALTAWLCLCDLADNRLAVMLYHWRLKNPAKYSLVIPKPLALHARGWMVIELSCRTAENILLKTFHFIWDKSRCRSGKALLRTENTFINKLKIAGTTAARFDKKKNTFRLFWHILQLQIKLQYLTIKCTILYIIYYRCDKNLWSHKLWFFCVASHVSPHWLQIPFF